MNKERITVSKKKNYQRTDGSHLVWWVDRCLMCTLNMKRPAVRAYVRDTVAVLGRVGDRAGRMHAPGTYRKRLEIILRMSLDSLLEHSKRCLVLSSMA
jgi:hypothetical protein